MKTFKICPNGTIKFYLNNELLYTLPRNINDREYYLSIGYKEIVWCGRGLTYDY